MQGAPLGRSFRLAFRTAVHFGGTVEYNDLLWQWRKYCVMIIKCI